MEFIIFFGLQLINVILSTIRQIATIKSPPKIAALLNAIAYTFYIVIVKLIGTQSFVTVIIATFFTNLIGTIIATIFIKKFKTEARWRIEVRVFDVDKGIKLHNALTLAELEYDYVVDINDNLIQIFYIYTDKQKQSRMLRKLLSELELNGTNIVEMLKSL